MITILTTITESPEGQLRIDHKPSGLDTATDLEKEFGKMYYIARAAVEKEAMKALECDYLGIEGKNIHATIKTILDEQVQPLIDAGKRSGLGLLP